MFKKLKDKLTEEVKIPSQKFTQSMQQLAQVRRMTFTKNNCLTMITFPEDSVQDKSLNMTRLITFETIKLVKSALETFISIYS